ncbi:unnamed protein product [Rotaria sp. Silwood2]|nr:unnamed protein product [Rotaria sp. Silwood2]
MQQTPINSNLQKYQNDRETCRTVLVSGNIVRYMYSLFFSCNKPYKGINLLDIHDSGDCGRYARRVMKILFTPAEMSESILYANPTYAKPGLDPKHAVCARFNINPLHWDEFFSTCLHRSLTQILCDVYRDYKHEL